jgi:hypothetical protein
VVLVLAAGLFLLYTLPRWIAPPCVASIRIARAQVTAGEEVDIAVRIQAGVHQSRPVDVYIAVRDPDRHVWFYPRWESRRTVAREGWPLASGEATFRFPTLPDDPAGLYTVWIATLRQGTLEPIAPLASATFWVGNDCFAASGCRCP